MSEAEGKAALLRRLPQVDELMRRADLQAALASTPRWALVEAARALVDEQRRAILASTLDTPQEITSHAIVERARHRLRPSLRRVLNATGVVLHTNLGRAPLAAHALDRVVELNAGYTNLEYDLESGGRGARHEHAAGLLAELCGAEAALVVNNGAAAAMLALATLGAGRESIVSRGELVEIGGAFRIPDILRASGSTLVEVGTTNRTHRHDYENAITDHTALLLKVHRSNFALVGFTSEVTVEELAAIGKTRALPLVYDLGSGALLRLADLGLQPDEPTVQGAVRAGADVITCSADKLMGGPQAGLLLGKREHIDACQRHPLMRVFRPSRLTLAALTATLELYRDGRTHEIPAIQMLATSESQLQARAERLCKELQAANNRVVWKAVRLRSAVGGGSMPLCEPWSWGIDVEVPAQSAATTENRLRHLSTPVIGRIEADRVLLDLRAVALDEEPILGHALRELCD